MNLTPFSPTSSVDFRKHSIYRFTDEIWKIVQFYDDRERTGPGPIENHQSYDEKLASSMSRSKRCILEDALCNPWDYFVTLTISPEHDRDDLNGWRKTFLQWLRDRRKRGSDISYLLIPERHEDGSWHAHGLLRGIPDTEIESFVAMRKRGVKVPSYLVRAGYLNWIPYGEKFGFCSLGKINRPIAAAFYCTKYVTKDNSRLVSDKGCHLYFHSRPLNRPDKLTDIYTRSPELERLLSQKHDFCATGFAFPGHQLDWADFLSLDTSTIDPIDFSQFVPLEDASAMAEADAYYDFEQLVMEKYARKCNYRRYI